MSCLCLVAGYQKHSDWGNPAVARQGEKTLILLCSDAHYKSPSRQYPTERRSVSQGCDHLYQCRCCQVPISYQLPSRCIAMYHCCNEEGTEEQSIKKKEEVLSREEGGWWWWLGERGVSDQKGINSIPLVTLIYGRTNKTLNPCMENINTKSIIVLSIPGIGHTCSTRMLNYFERFNNAELVYREPLQMFQKSVSYWSIMSWLGNILY